MRTQIKQFLLDAYHTVRSQNYRLLRRSILFNSHYYLEKYPDVAQSGTNPILHYLHFGYSELRQPSAFFDPIYYLMQVPELKDKGEDPLTHYLKEGFKAGLWPNPLFDPIQYVDAYPQFKKSRKNPYLHFLRKGSTSPITTSSLPYFHPGYYYSRYPEIKELGLNPLYHYLNTGIEQGLQPSIWFNAAWYQDRYNLKTSPLTHYLVSGCQQAQSPIPLFDPGYYVRQYQIPEGADPLLYYITTGRLLNHKPIRWFDSVFYQFQYLKDVETELSALEHFLTTGLKTGLYPNEKMFSLPFKPTISILVPVYNVEIEQLNNCIRSVIYQSYPHWELCLADDCSTRDDIRPLIEAWCAEDRRIKSIFLKGNSGISKATNMAASLATGDYLGFLDNDDELALHALSSFVEHVNSTGGDLFYSDEDLIGADARQHSVFRKPAFNQELLLNHNYITHFVLVKRSLFEKIGGCDSACDGAQDLDLFLKLSEQAELITHIPEILYHWRATSSSTSINHSQKDYADEAGKLAIEAALQRRNIRASVSFTSLKYYYRVKKQIKAQPSASLIVYFECDQNDPVAWFRRLIQLTSSPIDTMVAICRTNKQYDALCKFTRNSTMAINMVVQLYIDKGLAHNLNSGCKEISTDFLIFISNRINIINPEWLQSLIEYGQGGGTGMVGGKISCENEALEPVTHIPDTDNLSPLYYSRFITNSSCLMNGRHCPQEVLSVNWEFSLIKTELFNTMQGFNAQTFPHLFAVHDLCYRLRERGKKNIFTPYAESGWQDYDNDDLPPKNLALLESEKKIFQKTWLSILQRGDPFYNQGIVIDRKKSVEEFTAWLTGESNYSIDN